jgi:6-phosphogluconolactonase (cycloisomerase 2 family)
MGKYKATSYEDKNPNDRTICFSFENAGPQGSICVFQIYVYTKAEWGTITKKPIYISENNQYVFSYDYDKNCVQASQFECERIKEVPQIMTTFSFK